MNPVPYMETLQRIAAGMGPQRGFQSSLNSLLSLLTERHGFLRPHLVIFDPETRTLRLCVADGAPRSAQVVYEPGMGVTGQVFVTGKPVIVECLKGHPVFLSKFFMRTDEELSSLAFLSVPVLAPQMSWEPGREQRQQTVTSVGQWFTYIGPQTFFLFWGRMKDWVIAIDRGGKGRWEKEMKRIYWKKR